MGICQLQVFAPDQGGDSVYLWRKGIKSQFSVDNVPDGQECCAHAAVYQVSDHVGLV